MTSITDKLNNVLVLEHFSRLQETNLEPKLGVYDGNRLVIVSQLTKEIETLQGDLSHKQGVLDNLVKRIEGLKVELSNYVERSSNAEQETGVIEKELLAKKQFLRECNAAENKIPGLNR